MEIGHIDGVNHIVDFVSRYASDTEYPSNANYENRTALQSYLTSFYNSMTSDDRQYIKEKTCTYFVDSNVIKSITQKVWIPSRNEVLGNLQLENNYQLTIFMTASNRIRMGTDGRAKYWQLSTRNSKTSGNTDCINQSGTHDSTAADMRTLPCFRLIADV